MGFLVTPYAGVWIEIFVSGDFIYTKIVTPYAGVWIEIFRSTGRRHKYSSLPTRECGLKSA